MSRDEPDGPGRYFEKGRFVPSRLADEILSDTVDHFLVTPITERGGDTIWVYHPELGIFKPDGIAYVEGQAQKLLLNRCKRSYVGDVLKLVQISSYTPRKNFEEDPNVLVLENNVLHLDTGKLTKHNSIHNAKAKLPIKHDPNAECPAILKFLSEVIPDAVDTFQEWMGYHLIRDYRFAKALMLIGDGENGKSVLLTLMRAFLGSENVSEVDLYRLAANRFAAAELYGKLANLAPDVGSDELKRTGTFKALTGNDTIMAERKHQQLFGFRNYAKLSFSTNKLPLTPDMSRAFFRRWLFINCPNFFTGDDADPTIIEKITTPKELSGFLNWALKGRQRLIQNGRFTQIETAEKIKEHYDEMSNPVTAFIQSCVITNPEGVVTKDSFYNAYHSFCRMKGFSPVLKNVLTNELKPQIFGLGEGKRKIGKVRKMCWMGVALLCEECEKGQCSAHSSSNRGHINSKQSVLIPDASATCKECGELITDSSNNLVGKTGVRVCNHCLVIWKKERR